VPDLASPLVPMLALQRAIGNRAVGDLLAGRSQGTRMLARAPLSINPRPELNRPREATRDVNEQINETISHAPAAFNAWNGNFNWRSKWRLRLTSTPTPSLEVVLKLQTTASAAVKRAWAEAILKKWDNKFSFCVLKNPMPAGAAGNARYGEAYPIRIRIMWTDPPITPDYTIAANAAGANEGGRAGLGGTTSMTGWGTADTVDITHEFGHILGCPEEYFTTNGVDWAAQFGGVGFRAARGGIMNNPAGPVLKRNFDFVRGQAATLRGVAVGQTEVV